MRFLLRALVLVLLVLAVALPTALSTFVHSERAVSIGAHDAIISPHFGGHAEIDLGPLLPQIRVPADNWINLGVQIRLGDTEVGSIDDLLARDAVIASQPQGEIAALRSTVLDMWWAALARGVGVAMLVIGGVVLAWRAVGESRRREVWRAFRRPEARQLKLGAAIALTSAVALFLVSLPERPEPDDLTWVPIGDVIPNLPSDDVLDTLEITEGSTTRGGQALIEGALTTYRASQEFYGKLAVAAVTVDLRAPLEGETTALVVTDRHDNVGMDPVARAIASRAQSTVLIDLGDDTSNGASWEAFSINSLAREFTGFDVVAVAGNHDTGPFVRDQMADKGFTVLDDEPVEVAGIRFLGSSDPRSSGLTAGYAGDAEENATAVQEQAAKLADEACDDGDVSVVAVHSPTSGRAVAETGCVDLVLSGHLHRQVGPDTVTGANGRSTTTLTTGTTGGAVYAFALGSKLRRPAQVSVLTFADGRPVGVQVVTFDTGGAITAGPYTPLALSAR